MSGAGASVRVFPGAGSLYRAAARAILHRASDAVAMRGRFSIVLSGGSTPIGLYRLLAGEFAPRMPWAQSHFFWGDERMVPPDHPDSNYRAAMEAMLSHVPVPASNLHRIRVEEAITSDRRTVDETGAKQVAESYSREIRDFFSLPDPAGGARRPSFDLILLGMGPDGHTASLFPGTDALHIQDRLATANWVPKLSAFRITMTIPLINGASCVLFLVEGGSKAEALNAVLHGEYLPERYPAQLIHPEHGDLIWMLDQAASLERPKGG
jgi:6-phosphogluconolactonase